MKTLLLLLTLAACGFAQQTINSSVTVTANGRQIGWAWIATQQAPQPTMALSSATDTAATVFTFADASPIANEATRRAVAASSLVVACNGEALQVVSLSGNAVTVARAAGTTTAIAHAANETCWVTKNFSLKDLHESIIKEAMAAIAAKPEIQDAAASTKTLKSAVATAQAALAAGAVATQ